MGNAVSVFSSNRKYRHEENEIKSLGKKLLSSLKKSSVSCEVYLVSNREIKALNRKFLGKNRATNVLSFDADPPYAGEIFLAPDYIRARGEDLAYLFIHGFLHLLGYTHNKKRDRIKMEKLEDKLSKSCLNSSPD